MKRRGFLKLLGVGAAATAVAPLAAEAAVAAPEPMAAGTITTFRHGGATVGSISVPPAFINDGIRQFMQQVSNYRFDAD